jgi:PAS domain S-box-containing protein
MPQKIFTATPNGDYDYLNQQWMDFTGLSFELMKNAGWTQFIHPDDVDEHIRLWKHAIATGEPFQFVHRVRRADGLYRWHLSRARAMRDSAGDVTMWIGSNTEIHEQKQIEEQLRRLNDDLNQFAFAASHDLQEPLRMVTSYSQLLVQSCGDQLGEEPTLCVGFIEEGTRRMRTLLADLLAYTQVAVPGEESIEEVDTNLALENAIKNLEAAIEESEAVVTHGRLPRIAGRSIHFVQVFQNLIGNAIKYRGASSARIHVSAEKRKNEWKFAVKDNGMGIEGQYHKTIFGVFKRLHGKAIPGTGIGLAICQRVVERYGGRIWVESKPGEGATFYFTMPLLEGEN